MGLFRKAALTVARGLGLTDRQFVQWFGGEPSHSGESVTVDTALTLDAVWACTRLTEQLGALLGYDAAALDALWTRAAAL